LRRSYQAPRFPRAVKNRTGRRCARICVNPSTEYRLSRANSTAPIRTAIDAWHRCHRPPSTSSQADISRGIDQAIAAIHRSIQRHEAQLIEQDSKREGERRRERERLSSNRKFAGCYSLIDIARSRHPCEADKIVEPRSQRSIAANKVMSLRRNENGETSLRFPSFLSTGRIPHSVLGSTKHVGIDLVTRLSIHPFLAIDRYVSSCFPHRSLLIHLGNSP